MTCSAGNRFRQALREENPLQIMGVVNAYCAMMAQDTGYKALYLSGAGVANVSYGLPDLGIINLTDVLADLRRITDAVDLPVLVDVDTGFGGPFNIARVVKTLIKEGAAAMHMEDQVSLKRCGHRPGKELVSPVEMVDRIKAAVDARTDDDFSIVARTDALAVEGLGKAVDRACMYMDAGADMIFAEACTELDQYKTFADTLGTEFSLLANMTEFSQTPGFTVKELKNAGVSAILYPLSASRAMNAAALRVFRYVREHGSAEGVLDIMQNREELYDFLHYHEYEDKADELFKSGKI